jgi:hypothetical protein
MGMGIASLAGAASAGPWSIEPRVGVSTDHSTNPELRAVDPVSEEHVAALFNLPLRYDADGEEFSLTPSGRISNSQGYSSLASSYARLDSAALFQSDLGSLTLQAAVLRDSSLYNNGLAAYGYGVGVRRDTANVAGDWTHSLTERLQVQLDGGWTRVTYDQPAIATSLVDYRYVNAGPMFSYVATERDTLKLLGNVGLYQSLDRITQSKSANVELGYVRQLDQVWSLSADAGYSQSKNSTRFFFGPFYLGTLNSNQDGTVYSVNLARHGERINLGGAVSRALQPTGFAYLSRQNSITGSISYAYSERLSLSSSIQWQKESDPTRTGGTIHLQYLNAQLTANWSVTPQWVLSLHAMHYTRKYGPPNISGSSNDVGLDLVRQFPRTDL